MISGVFQSKMATKNCPKCDNPNPVACKKCACGHVFFTTRRSANAIAPECDDISEPTTPQEPEIPRRRTARVTRERPQFYDALQVENQTRRQKELQKRRKASKSEDVEASSEEIPEKVAPPTTSKRRAESPPAKVVEPPRKKRRGRPPGLTNRKSGRAQILASKSNDAKGAEGMEPMGEDELELVGNLHQVPAAKALQMNMVLSDINCRISSSSVRAEVSTPKVVPQVESAEKSPVKIEKNDESIEKKDERIEREVVSESKELVKPKDILESDKKTGKAEEIQADEIKAGEIKAEEIKTESKAKIEDVVSKAKNDIKVDDIEKKEELNVEAKAEGKTEAKSLGDFQEKEIKVEPEVEVSSSQASLPEQVSDAAEDKVDAGGDASALAEQNGEANNPDGESGEASAPSGNSATRCAFPC